MNIASVRTTSIGELAELSATELHQLQQQADAAVQHAKDQKDRIEGAIAFKYAERAQALRQQAGKDTGTVHFDDDGIRVTAELPKKPEWDQKKLGEIAQRIGASGENPAEYLDITYKVAERKYTAWPDSLRAAFEPARVLKTGKATFRLATTGEA